MVGMRDVARKAGVSLSTVSLVVNGTGYVSDAMRTRVEAAMRELDYIPNELARNLFRGRTGTIGVIVPTIRHPFFASLAAALQRAFAAQGRRTLLCSTADADAGEAEYVDMLRRHMMDGIVMAAHTEHTPDYWTSIGRPVVAFDRMLGEGIPTVGSDHEQGGRLAAERLLAGGARHVVTVGGPRSQFDAAVGDPGAAGAAGTFPTVRYHLTVERLFAQAGGRWDYVDAGAVSALADHAAAARAVFDRFPDADAIVGSDLVAACCVQEAWARGIRVPEDVQIVAYDGTYVADVAGVPLTAVVQDLDAIADRIAARMDAAIGGGDGAAGGAGAADGAADGAAGDISGTGSAVGEGPAGGAEGAGSACAAPDVGAPDIVPVRFLPRASTR